MRPRTRRLAALGAATAFGVPSLLGAAATPAAAEPTPTPAAAATSTATPTATPTVIPTPTVDTAAIGGPRMSERGVIYGGGAEAPPETAGASYVVADADSGQILAAKDPHGRYRPASTLKTLLALAMLPRLDKNGTYTADNDDAAVEGTRVGMVPTQTYPIDLLWYGLILRSGNDAANGLAKAGADGDLAKAIRMMNAEAQRLQALDTTAVNPSGLDADGQYSSAYDLALFGRAALERGDMRRYMKAVKIVFPGNHTKTATKKTAKSFDVFTGNRLVLRGYDGVVGVKNGYTTLARNTNIAAAERDGRTFVVSIMRSPGAITADSEALLDWAFANADRVVPVGTLVDPATPVLVTPEDGPAQGPGIVIGANLAGGATQVEPGDAVHAAGTAPLGRLVPLVGGVAAALFVAGGGARAVVVRKRRRRLEAFRARQSAQPPAGPAGPAGS